MEDIINTRLFLDRQISQGKIKFNGEPFSKYQVVYFTSNENVKETMNNLCQDNNYNNGLCVMASGDQVFEMISKGIYNIDTFDKNKLTEYYVLGLKRAMILKYNYEEYLNSIYTILDFSQSKENINNIVYDCIPYMDTKYRIFWKNIMAHYETISKNFTRTYDIFDLFFINFASIYKYSLKYTYLQNEDSYNEFKKNLINCNITFKELNAVNIPNKINKKYDIIYLSNILDYFYYEFGYEWPYSILNDYVNNLLNNNVNDDGAIMLHYIFNYYAGNRKATLLINNSLINSSDLKNYEIYEVNRVHESNKIGDGNIIVRKR